MFTAMHSAESEIQVAHDRAADIMSKLNPVEGNIQLIPEQDRLALQDYYRELQQRHALLAQCTQESSVVCDDDEDDEPFSEEISEAELQKAAEFPRFLQSLHPSEEATKQLIQGSKHVTTALGMIEKGAGFLENVPMQRLVDMYERIKSREERLKDDGAPVSLVNARIYWSETVTFKDTVHTMILIDMAAPTVDEVSAEMVTEDGVI
ncbi:hypothetical protein K438DRAFT_2018223 [Mycena galopus ATCC 62051]|nr:hypothetical protein K438DRAFT_2018223 [Mycena galopus ATCC 62051]